MADAGYHIPVLLNEILEGLKICPEGIYVDCTMGGGGHSRAILEKLGSRGRLIGFDQDPDAAAQAPDDPRMLFIPHNFRHLSRFLRLHRIDAVDGLLADLGVSSHQFDDPGRGFSTRFEGVMDMRMDREQALTAARVLEEYSEERLQKIFSQYGEVSNARTLARTIVKARAHQSLSTSINFRNAVRTVVKGNPHKYFAQVFQALRIEVNDELGALEELLEQLPDVLKPGGRAVIISFHSLEDRLVKQFFKAGNSQASTDDPFRPVLTTPPLKVITKKPIVPSAEEIRRNPRSRSAKLRIAEKVMAK